MNYQISSSELTVGLDTFGGTMTSVQDRNGTEFLWQGDKTFWSGQAPVLFPICGSIRDDKAVTESGKMLAMPRHGLVRKREFTLVSQTKNSASFVIESDEGMLAQYPYAFRLHTAYQVEDCRITVTYTAENLSDEVMPFQIGGHPGFCCPFEAGTDYTDYYLELEKEESCTVPTPVTETGLIDMAHRSPFLNGEKRIPLRHELFHRDSVILDELQSRKIRFVSKQSGHGVEVDFADFPYLILWSSSNDGPFIALEPWIGLSTCSDEDDIFEHKRNIQRLAPKESRAYSFSISVF